MFGETRVQRCWVHKTANVLNKLPKHLQPKSDLHQICMADTRENARLAFNLLVQTYLPKYPKAAECLNKDKDALLTFYDFPAEHWMHLRTTNPIESTFATVRLRTAKTRGCVSRAGILSMVFKLAKSAGCFCAVLSLSPELSPAFSSKTASVQKQKIIKESPPDHAPIHNI